MARLMKKSRDIIKVDFSLTPAFIMDLCYAAHGTRARRGDRMAQRLRNEWRLHPVAGKLIADFDAKRLRRGRGQPKGFVHEHLLERDRYIIALVETAQAQIAAQTGLRNPRKRAYNVVADYLCKQGAYRNQPGDAYFGDRLTRLQVIKKITTIMRRHTTRRNAN